MTTKKPSQDLRITVYANLETVFFAGLDTVTHGNCRCCNGYIVTVTLCGNTQGLELPPHAPIWPSKSGKIPDFYPLPDPLLEPKIGSVLRRPRRATVLAFQCVAVGPSA